MQCTQKRIQMLGKNYGSKTQMNFLEDTLVS